MAMKESPMNLHPRLALALAGATALALAGCGSAPRSAPPSASTAGAVERAEARDEAREAAAQEQALNQAYEQGVQDVLEDYAGRMRANEQFIYDPPIVEELHMPSEIRSGALYPSRSEKVIIRPGGYRMGSGVRRPAEEDAGSVVVPGAGGSYGE